MAYGTIKVDNITFDNGGVDKLITVSGLFYSTSGALTVTGTISGGNVTAPTATFTTLTGTTTAGTTATFTSGSFTSLTGVTTTVTSGVFGLGSAAAPSIAISGDPNTGIYSPGADQVAISTNGTGRITVDASGNVNIDSDTLYVDAANNRVGIGTSGPVSGLDLAGSVPVFTLKSSTNTGSGTPILSSVESFSSVYGLTNAKLSFLQGSTGFADQGEIGIYTKGFDGLNERVRVTNAGLVGIGTTSPGQVLDVKGIIQTIGTNGWTTNGDTAWVYFGDNNNRVGGTRGGTIGFYSDYAPLELGAGGGVGSSSGTQLITFKTGTSERARIDSSGRLLVGTTTATNNLRLSQSFAVVRTGSDYGGMSLTSYNGTTPGVCPIIDIQRSRGTADGTFTKVQQDDRLGVIVFRGSDGSAFQDAALIDCWADGEWNTSGDTTDSPGRLVFSTTAEGAASPTERMRIGNDGRVLVGKLSNSFSTVGLEISSNGGLDVTRSAAAPIFLNRLASDGNLIEFYQDTTLEGTISVSGTTVSYNGAHLSRWSQLPSGVERTEILRGSVLSNINEMCEWPDEDNEQLNRMKVSDVECDKNVAGVFQAWDDDDDTYTDDFYCAMTGDFIIRIAEGVTVERGDLLMSAGDGTATPQDDDIIRSKTIAKVTSTNVSCTYEDGSYCVPCVLMAC